MAAAPRALYEEDEVYCSAHFQKLMAIADKANIKTETVASSK